MDGIQNILKAISKNIGRDLTKETDSIKIIGKIIGRDISKDMDLIKIIGKITDNDVVKSIVNSVNENQNLSKDWLADNIKTNMDTQLLKITDIDGDLHLEKILFVQIKKIKVFMNGHLRFIQEPQKYLDSIIVVNKSKKNATV